MLVWSSDAEWTASSRKRRANSSSLSASGRMTLTATDRWSTWSVAGPDVGHPAGRDARPEDVAPAEDEALTQAFHGVPPRSVLRLAR